MLFPLVVFLTIPAISNAVLLLYMMPCTLCILGRRRQNRWHDDFSLELLWAYSLALGESQSLLW